MEQRELQKYVGRTIEIMYIDRHGKISQRKIELRSMGDGVVKAFCLMKESPRVFKCENILAVEIMARRYG
jgi:predicted DNA-binding transcriptional regulator YafY